MCNLIIVARVRHLHVKISKSEKYLTNKVRNEERNE